MDVLKLPHKYLKNLNLDIKKGKTFVFPFFCSRTLILFIQKIFKYIQI